MYTDDIQLWDVNECFFDMNFTPRHPMDDSALDVRPSFPSEPLTY